MSSSVRHIAVDCVDARALAAFWVQVLGQPAVPDEDDTAEEPVIVVGPLLLANVPERKTAKNRLHLDLQPDDRTRDAEVERILALGATLLDDRRNPDGTGWVVLADPEGNEFCVERSAPERH